jgi:hypothetical protein
VSPDSSAATCFPEGADDGGTEGICSTLPYAAADCAADDDAGVEGGGAPLGVSLCFGLKDGLKPAAFSQLLDCLKKAPGVPDGGACTASDTAAAACSTNLFKASTCAVPASTSDGGATGCAQVVAACAGDAGGGITLEKCQGWLGPFSAAARQAAFDCFNDPASEGGGTCAEKFEGCVFPPL